MVIFFKPYSKCVDLYAVPLFNIRSIYVVGKFINIIFDEGQYTFDENKGENVRIMSHEEINCGSEEVAFEEMVHFKKALDAGAVTFNFNEYKSNDF